MKLRASLKGGLAGLLCLTAMMASAPSGAEIVWHGYTLNRMYQPQGGPTRFRVERLSLYANANITDKLSAYVELYYHPWVPAVAVAEPGRIYLESAYTDYKMDMGTLRIGKGRRVTFGITPSYPNRKTTQYGIFSEAFTQDRVQGIQWFNTADNMEVGLGLTTAHRLGNRSIGGVTKDPANAVASLADRDVPEAINEHLELSGKIGILNKDGMRFGVTGSYSKLDAADLTWLDTNFGGTHTSKTRSRYGVYATYPFQDFVLQAQFVQAKTSDIKHNGYEILAGYDPKGMKNKFYVRYAQVAFDVAETASQYTWDKQQICVAYVYPISKSVWLEAQYERNTENQPSGTADVKNDLVFVELFTGF